MGQTSEILPRVKKIYKFFFRSTVLISFAKAVISKLVDTWATAKGFYFPSKFNWDWKWEMLTDKYESAAVAEFKKIIKSGMTAVDIGAHIGYFTRLFSGLVGPTGRVLAFEADPDNFQLLNQNVADKKNVLIYQLAISDQIGLLDFFKSSDKTGSHSLLPADSRPTKVTVVAETLDHFLSEQGINQVDVIKMDIEGAEPLAIKGMANILRNNYQIKMLMEFSPSNLSVSGITLETVLLNLLELGFRLRPLGHDLEITDPQTIIDLTKNKFGYVHLLIYR